MNSCKTAILQSFKYDNKNIRKRFNLFGKQILESMPLDSESCIIVDDSLLGELCVNFFNSKGYYNIIVYYKGEKPNINGKFQTFGPFVSDGEIRLKMKNDSFLSIMV
jgi:hypothetical protein